MRCMSRGECHNFRISLLRARIQVQNHHNSLNLALEVSEVCGHVLLRFDLEDGFEDSRWHAKTYSWWSGSEGVLNRFTVFEPVHAQLGWP